MKINKLTGLLVLSSVLAGSIFAVMRDNQSRKENHILASYASEKDLPTLANAIRQSDFVGEVRILDMKRRGMFIGYDEASHQMVIDENDGNLAGDEVLLKAQDIRRDGLVTEYYAEVISVIAGSLELGDRFTMRVPGYGPLEQKGIEKNAASRIPVEIAGDEFLYILVKQADGVFAPMNAVTFRMKRDGDKLTQTFYEKEEMKDFDGSKVTMENLAQTVKDHFGKGVVNPSTTTTIVPPSGKDGLPTAMPGKPVDK